MCPIWGNEAGWPSRNRWCSWCGRHCGTTDESVVYVAVVHRETGAEGTMRLCPPCAYAPDGTVESRRLWRAWRRNMAAFGAHADELAAAAVGGTATSF